MTRYSNKVLNRVTGGWKIDTFFCYIFYKLPTIWIMAIPDVPISYSSVVQYSHVVKQFLNCCQTICINPSQEVWDLSTEFAVNHHALRIQIIRMENSKPIQHYSLIRTIAMTKSLQNFHLPPNNSHFVMMQSLQNFHLSPITPYQLNRV